LGNTVTLNGGGAPTYTWVGGVNTITNNAPFIPPATQQYTLYGSNACGTGSAMITVSVNPTPTLITTATPSDVCEGQTATLTASGASTYSWTGASSPGATYVITPTTTAAYTVVGISSLGCAGSTAQIVVTIPSPTVTAAAVSNKTLVCPGGSVTLTGSGADTYSWSTGANTFTSLVTPTTTQVYTVTGTSTVTQCFSTGTVEVVVFTPTLSISSNTTVCKGASITLTANAGPNSTYLWSSGSFNNTANITATASASYSVAANTTTVIGVVCKSTGTVVVTLHPDPVIKIVATKTLICKGDKAVLTASGGTAFTWTNPAATTPTVQVSPTIINLTTTYSVVATDTNGCQGSASIGVKVNDCTGLNEQVNTENSISIFPNPNNGIFSVQARGGMQLLLVNELGQVIKTLSFTEENNFRQNIQGLSSGIYFLKDAQNGSAFQSKLVVTD
jgi:hypothetical protein